MTLTYYKVCLLGEFAVGKTSLVRRFVYNEFQENYQTTIGVHIVQKHISLPSPRQQEVTLIIWDLAGGEPFSPVSKVYYRGAAGALIVADLSREATIDRLDAYYKAFRQITPNAPVVILLNKADLIPDSRHVQHTVTRTKELYGTPVFATSALTGLNVENAFLTLTTSIIDSSHPALSSPQREKRGGHA